MQNEFEKQVRHKMEELNLVPSEPVWEKIEEQIRKKKDRRRVILWLPLLCLFLAGGIWWLNSAEGDRVFANRENKKAESREGITKNEPTKTQSGQQSAKPEISSGLTRQDTPSESEINKLTGKISDNKTSKSGIIPSVAMAKPVIDREKSAIGYDASTTKANEQPQVKNNEKAAEGKDQVATEYKPLNPPAIEKENLPAQLKDSVNAILPRKFNRAVAADTNTRIVDISSTKKDEVPALTAEEKKDTSATAVALKPKPQRIPKWKFGISAAGGMAGISNGLNLFGQGKAMADATPVAMASTGTYFFDASPEQNRSYFSISAVVSRALSRKVSLSSGIGYHQYSTSIVVGKRLDSLMRSNLYSNQFANMGIGMQDYINRFHFISLPLGLDVRILKKLNLHGDLLLQELIASNALIFNFSSQQYFHDLNNYRRTQLSSMFGLDYALLDKKQTLLVGPQLQYSITRLEKEDLNKRLFSFGLRARLLFQKN